MSRPPQEILTAYGLAEARIEAIPSLINQTFLLDAGAEQWIVQRLNAVFRPEVHEDIHAVTTHLTERGIETPRLIPSSAGRLWERDERGEVWRVQTYIPGLTRQAIELPEQARSIGGLLARFHAALSDLTHEFVFVREGVHDTPRFLAQLEAHLRATTSAHPEEVTRLGDEIARFSQDVRVDFSALPRRTCHGDPKVSNARFWLQRPNAARCWIDLDTFRRQFLAYELGDALRSWCTLQGEDASDSELDVALFQHALEGYATHATDLLSSAEFDSIVDGLQTVCVELAARFWIDAIEDRYFGWDASRFASRTAHNLVRAKGQLSLARSVRGQFAQLSDITRSAFPG